MPDAPRLATPTAPADPSANSYDEVPYDSNPFPYTHPARVATVATLFGLRPPPVATCRVLELGCASGGNLVPMAESLPGGEFVGVDFSARQIADGEHVVRESGLKNVQLRHASILDIDDSYGRFDYVICHGVFSWVPDAVRDKILAVCRDLLTPDGVAYVSYNTYPGWHMRGMIRDMMRYHATRFDTPALRVQQARALLDFLAQTARNDGGAYATLLRTELEHLRHQADHYLYHEHLEDVNNPLYFHEFVELARRHDLRYLGEARLTTMVTGNFGPEVQKALRVVAPDQVQAEQYMDFVRNRTFRESLLVRADATPDWSIQTAALRGLHLTTPHHVPDVPGEATSPAAAQYQTPSGMTLSTSSPVMKAAMRALSRRWPATAAFEELAREVTEMLGREPDDRDELATGLLSTYLSSDLLEILAHPIPEVAAGNRPAALAVIRARLAAGETGVTTRRHEHYRTSELDRKLIPQLDGTRDRAALAAAMADLALAGQLRVERQGRPLTDPAELRQAVGEVLDKRLEDYARLALLSG
ncbi:MAG TPA: class I SAM-dependent methyltransferase [Gemmata sp.]|nr:class I SAM-dependent methyltransferase [Gemmata sp.]